MVSTPKRIDRSRTLILDAAAGAFAELGFGGASMEEIARRAGLTRKTVYNLFKSKEDLALAFIAQVEAEPEPLYRARMAANENALDLLERVLADSAGWCLANPSLARLALAPSQRPDLAPPPDRPSFQRLVRDVLVLGQGQGVIRRDEDADFMSLVVLGIYAQAMLTALAGGHFSVDQIGRLVGVVVQGIGVTPTPAHSGH